MSGGSSIYSPLPQSNSDSDELSEEELHSSNERQRVIKRMSKHQKHATCEIISNDKKQNIKNYKQRENVERNVEIASNGFQIGTDEITVLKANNRVEKFSTSRKICFSFSIFLCISTTIVFLWILPCEIGSCPQALNLAQSNSWKKVLSGKELLGPISVVPHVRGRSHNLIFLYRNSFKILNETRIMPREGGVMSLLGGNGDSSWCMELQGEPKDIDCGIIDIDLDGSNDCLAVGRNNLLRAFQPLSGKILWDLHGSTAFDSKSCEISFPIALPDLDGDRVSDLLTICSFTGRRREQLVSGPKNYFILISGLIGKVMGSPTEISHCYSIRSFMLEKENFVSYTCLDPGNEESLKTIPLIEIISNEEPSMSKKISLNRTDLRTQHKPSIEENIFYLQGRRLNLENQGRCPDECNMLVTIKDERNEKKNRTLWTMKSSSSYGMIPVVMKFDKITGFVLKYWHWESDVENALFRGHSSGNDSASIGNVNIKKRRRRLNPSKSLESELFGESQQESARGKRMLDKRESNEGNKLGGYIFEEANHIFRRVIERVVLIVFNETDSHSINASQSKITQICNKRDDCQPDVLFQKRSLLITDLDEDNMQELISYSSTFVSETDEEEFTWNGVTWQLQSTVQVIRLEAELHKLYDNTNR